MKKVLKALWHGIKSVFTAVVEWVETLFGMKDNGKYGLVLRRIVGTAFAVVVLFWAASGIAIFLDEIDVDVSEWFDGEDNDAFLSKRITDDLFFYDGYYDNLGYLANADGKKLIKRVEWIAKPYKGDSLVCYSDGELRGYFHMRDGHVVIKPAYIHAWVFSEGLAAVYENECVKFIDTEGRVAIDRGFAYDYDIDGYVFHKGHCAVNDSTGMYMGLIDRNGEWVIAPQYESIFSIDTFWLVRNGDQEAILTFGMDTVMPLTAASFSFRDTVIDATFSDHTQNRYDRQGRLLAANLIRNVDQLLYDTREVVYPSRQSNDDEYYDSEDHYIRKAVATCQRYEAETDWYGLMSPDGKFITPPCYVSIEAVDKDLYLCETRYGHGVLLNSKGLRVQ